MPEDGLKVALRNAVLRKQACAGVSQAVKVNSFGEARASYILLESSRHGVPRQLSTVPVREDKLTFPFLRGEYFADHLGHWNYAWSQSFDREGPLVSHMNDAALEVDIVPGEIHDFADAHHRLDGKDYQLAKLFVIDSIQQACELMTDQKCAFERCNSELSAKEKRIRGNVSPHNRLAERSLERPEADVGRNRRNRLD